MNSRDRLLNCLRHEPVDRVPISTYELVGWNPAAWENKDPSYRRLMDTIRESTDCVYMDNPDFINGPEPELTTAEWDEGASHFVRRTWHAPQGDLTTLQRTDAGMHTTWTLRHLLDDIEDIDIYLSLPERPRQLDMSRFNAARGQLGDKGLMMISLGDPICAAAELFEMGTFLTHAITETTKIKSFLDILHERQMRDLRQILRHDVRDVIFRICGPEYATPPYLPPNLFPDLVTCYLQPICREIRAAGGIPRIHAHGRIGQIIDQLALTEAMAIDPIEPPPDGDIDLAAVKLQYGRQFCLFGNIELRELEFADRSRIDRLVRQAMDDAKAGGGFVLMPTAAPINSPLAARTEENYRQLIESALAYGQY